MNYRERMPKILVFLFGSNDPIVQQKHIVQWLRGRGNRITEAALSNFKKEFEEEKKMGIARVKKFCGLLEAYIEDYLQYEFDQETNSFIPNKNKNSYPIGLRSSSSLGHLLGKFEQVDFLSGRLLLSQKVKLIENARLEIIEVGVRLKTFTSYFESQSDAAYTNFIIDALKRGVELKCLVLNPKAEITRHYFKDRILTDFSEEKSIEIIETVVAKLKNIRTQLAKESYAGSLNVFTYSHFPHNHFFSIDRNTPQGVIIISSYLYGVKRAKCPVFIVTKQGHPALFGIYNSALDLILNDIEEIE